MRSNFAQPQGADHQGVFRHAYSPTDEELLARARGWLAAGDVLVRAEYLVDEGPRVMICWWVMSPEKVMRDSLPGHLATTLLNYGEYEPETRPFTRASVTVYRKKP